MRPGLACFALTALSASLALPAVAQEAGPIVAVFDLDDRTKALEEGALKDLADYLAVLLTQGGWQVVPRDQLRARLKEAQTDSYKACVDQSCQVELGRELAAQKTLSTQIFKLGSKCRVTATLYDLKRAATEKAEKVESECDPEKLGLALEQIAGKITLRLDQAGLEKARKEQEDREAADRKAVEEAAAQKKVLEEEQARQRAAEEEATRKKAQEEEAARQKALADEAAGQKPLTDEAAKEREPQAPEGGIGDHLGVVGAHVGVLSPGLGDESGVALEWQGYEGEADTELGACFDLGLDFLIGRYFSIGLAVGYLHADTQQTFQEGTSFVHHDTFDYMAFSLRLKGRLPVADVVELRLGLNVGAGLWIHAPKIEVDKAGDRFSFDISSGFAGVAAGGLLEVSWWVLPELGLVFGFGVMAQPTGPLEGPPPPNAGSLESSVTYDMMFPPRLTFTLGAEYGF